MTKPKNNNKNAIQQATNATRSLAWPKGIPQYMYWPKVYRIVSIEKGPTGLPKLIKAFHDSNKTYPTEWTISYYENGSVMSISTVSYQNETNLPLCNTMIYDRNGHERCNAMNQWGYSTGHPGKNYNDNIDMKFYYKQWEARDPGVEIESDAERLKKLYVRDRWGRKITYIDGSVQHQYTYYRQGSNLLSTYTETSEKENRTTVFEYEPNEDRPKYVSESANGALQYEYFIEKDDTGYTLRVKDYVVGENYIVGLGSISHDDFNCRPNNPWFGDIRKRGRRFNNEEDYKLYHEELVKKVAAEERERRTGFIWGMPMCPMMMRGRG